MNKVYVKAVVEMDENGNKKPMSIVYKDKNYVIDRVLDVKNAVSMKVGGIGERYFVRIMNKETYIFFEKNKWFVEEKENNNE